MIFICNVWYLIHEKMILDHYSQKMETDKDPIGNLDNGVIYTDFKLAYLINFRIAKYTGEKCGV